MPECSPCMPGRGVAQGLRAAGDEVYKAEADGRDK